MYQKLVKNTTFNALGRLGAMASTIVLLPVIISSLGEERFAIWSLTTLFTSYISFLDFGIGIAYSKYIAEYHAKQLPDKINGVVVCGIGLYLLISVIVIATGHFLVLLALRIFSIPVQLQAEAQIAFWIALIVFAGASTFSVFEAVSVGLQKMEYNNLIVVLVTLLFTVASIIYVRAEGGLVGLMLIRALTTTLQIVLMYVVARRLLPTLSLSPRFLNVEQARELLTFGLKVQAGRLANLGTMNVNRVLVGSFVGLLGVSSYQIGHTVVEGIRNISMLVFSAMAPMASQIEAMGKRQDLLALYRISTHVTVMVAGAGFGLVAATAAPIIVLWTGKHYPAAMTVLVVLALANYIHVSTGTGTVLARGIGKPGLETRFGITLLLVNALLGWILGRTWGIDGILLATLIAYSVSSIMFMYGFNKVVGLPNSTFFRSVVFPPTVTMLMGVAVARILSHFWPFASSSIMTLSRTDAFRDILITGSVFGAIYFPGLLMLGYLRLSHLFGIIHLLRRTFAFARDS
jgi:O-antigen/teichoic acid export membrane protein